MADTRLEPTEIVVRQIRSPGLSGGPRDADEAVVFVHGNPGSSRDWEGLAAQAAKFARVVAFDLPGFGEADRSDHFEATLSGYAEHLGAMLEQLGIRRAHLVLHDFGGPWGLEWASRYPERVASISMFNCGVWLGYRWHGWARVWQTRFLGELAMATTIKSAFVRATNKASPVGLPDALVERMWRQYDAHTRRAVLRLYRDTRDAAAIGERHAQGLAPLRIPALVVWGRKDPFAEPELAHRQREAFPDATVVMLEKAGHWSFIDQPYEAANALMPFLRSHLNGSGCAAKAAS